MTWLSAIPRACVHTVRRAGDQNLQRLAASIAFYALFSLPALLVAAIHLAGLVYGEEASRERLLAQVERVFGEDPAATVDSVIQGAVAAGARRLLPRALALAALFFGASLTFFELQHALNRIWGTTHTRRWFVAHLLKRLVSFAMVLVVGAFLVASMVTSVGIRRFGDWVTEHLPGDVALGVVRWLDPAVALGGFTVLFALLFKVLPDGRVPWKRAWVGAFVTALLLVAAKSLVGPYLGVTDVGSVYGAAGSLVALLVWVYASSLVVLLGGAFAFSWEEVRTVRPAEPEPATPAPSPPREDGARPR
ncbi:MAG TPA: YihY/virulence factor BrkB family protein [Planctomycetota bacterium]|nr:YihY/virulence factor BrkB family protein [Planctomycetota bacterium]